MSAAKKYPGCGAEFESKAKLIDRVVEVHDSNCQICGAELNTREVLLQHNKECMYAEGEEDDPRAS